MAQDEEFADRWFWDGYQDWARVLAQYRTEVAAGTTHVPVFLAVLPEHSDLTTDGLVALFSGELRQFNARFESHELELAHGLSAEAALELFVYLDLSAIANDELRERLQSFFTILDVGLPVAVGGTRSDRDFSLPASLRAIPLVAVIDDGIGFLNERFTRVDSSGGRSETRFAGVWLQGRHKASSVGSSVFNGRTLDAAEINGMLAKGKRLVEAEQYAALNADLYDPDDWRTTEFAFTHGTHVLDIAAGADPYVSGGRDATDDWPILAVQIPPKAIADTSGKLFEGKVLAALRWILAVASTNSGGPLVINISLGVLAGPKNGRKFFEALSARLLRLWSVTTRRDVRVVFAYGNSLRTRQVARFETLTPGTRETLEWVIQPDDFTPSFVEIHVPGRDHLPRLAVGLTAPDGQTARPLQLPPHASRPLRGPDGRPYGMIYHTPSYPLDATGSLRTPARFDIAVAPTAARGKGELVIPSGVWTITVVNEDVEPCDVVLQIQRDDTAPGYPVRGRQSYFDGPNVGTYDPDTGDWSGLSPGPITRAGTNNALATGRVSGAGNEPLVLSVGAAARSRGAAEPVPAGYASRGAAWSSGPPDLSAIADDGFATTGVLASGTFSGSVVGMNGSSTAAPKVARRLAQELTGTAVPATPGETHAPVTVAQHGAQLGPEVLLQHGGARNRAPS